MVAQPIDEQLNLLSLSERGVPSREHHEVVAILVDGAVVV
jgi:hypothetical protein